MSIFSQILLSGFLIFFTHPILAVDSKIHIKLSNGTTGGEGSADLLRVILLKEAMLPIRELKSLSGTFTISDLDLPDGIPVLLQATYKGANYNKIIPPMAELRKAVQEIVVYESTNDVNSIQTRSLLQLVKAPDSIQVYKILLIQNKTNPPKAYQPIHGLDLFVPEDAVNLSGTWTQGNSKMAIPLEFTRKSDSVRSIERSVLPGSTEIQVIYSLPWNSETITVQDQILFEEKGIERPIFIRPKDMDVSFSSDPNPTRLTDEIPDGLTAYILLTGGTAITNRFSDSPRQIVNGNLIPDWDTSLVAVIGILALLFSFQYITDTITRKKTIK
jgi:hypothetical protein